MSAQPSPHEQEPRDLGFGAVVSSERRRLLNRDGSFNVEREGLRFWESLSLYHALLTMSWPRFLALIAAQYFVANGLFALLYLACGPSALAGGDASLSPLAKAFFFSVQTSATIGYGHIAPSGVAANVLVTIESLAGLLSFALVTGILFARFSRPTARIIFSERAVVAPYHGVSAFEFRIANARKNQIIELEAKVLFTRFEDEGGRSVRRYSALALERDRVAFFPLAWTIVHPIDEESPLFGRSPEDLAAASAEFLVLLTGFDETFSQTVHTRSSYSASEVAWGARFASVFRREGRDGRLAIDVASIHAVEKLSD